MFETHPRERVIVLVGRGELDLASEPAARHHLDVAAIGQWHVVVVDLSDVQFMDIAGARPFAAAIETFDRLGKQLFLLNPQPQVQRLLDYCGLAGHVVPLERLPHAEELADLFG